tara:strand:+ start:413 stop:643 length:231 start_codon:yes stop_codon:yes gene_type:complete
MSKIQITTDDLGVDLLLKCLKMLSLHGNENRFTWIEEDDVENALRMTSMIRNALDKGEVTEYKGLAPSKCEDGVCD